MDASNTKLGKECRVNIQQPEEAEAFPPFAEAFQEKVNIPLKICFMVVASSLFGPQHTALFIHAQRVVDLFLEGLRKGREGFGFLRLLE